MNSILVKVQLQGQISGCVKHTNRQKHTIKINSGYISKMILHTDRKEQPCSRVFKLSEEVVNDWISSNPPTKIGEKYWKKLSDTKKIEEHLKDFNEGFGVTFEEII